MNENSEHKGKAAEGENESVITSFLPQDSLPKTSIMPAQLQLSFSGPCARSGTVDKKE